VKRAILATGVLALLLGAVPARATVGGPTICDVLGWDAAARRVYVHLQPSDGGGSFGVVGYFAFGGEGLPDLQAADWSRTGENTIDDPDLVRRLARLRARLVPLARVTASALPWMQRATADTMHWTMGDTPRFRVLASFERESDFEVTTYYTPFVARAAVLAIPGRAERLEIFSFTGDPEEGGYETQVPVIVAPAATGTRRVPGRTFD
jgi:hypothetical protein